MTAAVLAVLTAAAGVAAIAVLAYRSGAPAPEPTGDELARLGRVVLDEIARADIEATIVELATATDDELLAELNTYRHH